MDAVRLAARRSEIGGEAQTNQGGAFKDQRRVKVFKARRPDPSAATRRHPPTAKGPHSDEWAGTRSTPLPCCFYRPSSWNDEQWHWHRVMM